MSKTVLSLDLCSAFIATSASAADLAPDAAPFENVQVCDAYGNQFYKLPGSDTCLRVGGRLRTDYRIRNFGNRNSDWGNRSRNDIELRARGYLYLDSRTQTEFGLLRTFTSFFSTVNTGQPTNSTVEFAYIQFGGLTTGRTQSLFDFWTGFAPNAQLETYSDRKTDVLAYTQSLGKGLSATLSLEDARGRRQGIAATGTVTSASYAGIRFPDLVGTVNLKREWGTAQIMGVLHDVYPENSGGIGVDSQLGWVIGAGINLQAGQLLGAGKTRVVLQGSYTDGASGYGTTGWNSLITDAVIVNGSDLRTTRTWNIFGGIRQPLTKTVTFNLEAGYHDVNGGTAAYDFTQFDVTPNLAWEPLSGFYVGAELQYRELDFGAASGLEDRNEVVGTFRLQRNF